MKKIIFTHSINSIVSKFTSLFLAIYFLKITGDNFVSVVLYYLLKYAVIWIFSFISLKLINKSNVLKMYRIGLFSNVLSLFVLLLMGEKVRDYIYFYAILDSATSLLYYSPYKVILYNFKNDKQFKEVFSYNSIVSSIITIISTVGMGYIIVNTSYSLIISIIILLVLIAVISTFYMKEYTFNVNPIKLSNIKYPFKDKQAKQLFKIVFLEGMGFRGGLDTTITFIIYLVLGTESSLGNLNAIFTLLGLITSIIVKKYLKEKGNKNAFLISALAILIVTIPIIFTNSFKIFILYNVIFNISYKITQILVDTAVFNVSENKVLTKYQLEYTYLHETMQSFGKAFSELILLIVVVYSFNLNNLRLVSAILSLSIIIQMFVYNQYSKKFN